MAALVAAVGRILYFSSNYIFKLHGLFRKTYSHYSLESRIHFRIHAAQTRLDQIMAEMAGTS